MDWDRELNERWFIYIQINAGLPSLNGWVGRISNVMAAMIIALLSRWAAKY